jgi:hypothetical protein
VRNSALQLVAAHYELTKSGITASQIRTKVRALERDQKFIYPYNPDHPFPDLKKAPTASNGAGGISTTASEAITTAGDVSKTAHNAGTIPTAASDVTTVTKRDDPKFDKVLFILHIHR